ncbi:hypothetical protein [Methylobacterium brachiatum]|uniref:hypothetical protein n=1 Tax=Methylobacterium brachiatum TaxID=269660 RepID=UPI0008E5FC97|nr:hypothetical protein [Methylobacterium brachiatum]SFJ68674.1 DNA polymerase [Methylobacterium brachiatum]
MRTVHVDFETRSACDLRKAGVHVYAEHPTTDVLCLAYAVDAEPVKVLTRDDCGSAETRKFLFRAIQSGATFVAHNAAFELAIWNRMMAPRFGWPRLPVEQTRCTMTMAYALGLPGSLENAAAAVGLVDQKDMDGRKVMMQLARPRRIEPDGRPVWWEEPGKLERLYRYCAQDVEAERALQSRLLPLSLAEQELWTIDQRINDRGIRVDLAAIESAILVVEETKQRLEQQMAITTGGWVSGCSKVKELGDWIAMRGVKTEGVAKADVVDLLARPDLPADVRRALELRRDAAKSSTAKLKAMRAAASDDGRIRGTLQFHGANTGRWAGRRVQTHNLPRPTMDQDDIDAVLDLLSKGEARDEEDLPDPFG